MTDSTPTTPPVIELHVHLEGTIRPATLLEIARRNQRPLPADDVQGLRELYTFRDFAEFVRAWLLTVGCLRTVEDFRQIVVDYAAEASGAGAVYLEGIFSPLPEVPAVEVLTGYAEGAVEAQERYGVTVRLTPDLHRAMDPAQATDFVRWAVRFRERGVVGIGLGGVESARPAAAYAEAFAVARDGGLGLVPHAGENAGAESVREVLAFAPERLRHGIRAVEDPAVLAEVADRGLVLDVCPTSNLRTGAVETLAAHPLPRLRAAGVPCTVNTDDPAMFDTDLGRELAVAAQLGVTPADAYAAGVAGALCDPATRQRLAALGAARFDAAGGEVAGADQVQGAVSKSW